MAIHPVLYHIDLCAGSGMLGLAVKLALGGRVRTVAYVEREAYAAAALVARMADAALDDAPVWDDVATCACEEFSQVVAGFRPLIVTAGYPCQPFSVAGKRLGVNDERHLWPHIDGCIGALEPECVFLENVPGHLRLGFASVRRDLQSRGYRVATGLFSASEVGASHRRERLFILALRLADTTLRGRRAVRKSSRCRGQSDGSHFTLANAEDAHRRARIKGVQGGARFGRNGFADHGANVGDTPFGQVHGGESRALESETGRRRCVHAASGDAGRTLADAEGDRGRARRTHGQGKGESSERTVRDGEHVADADGRNGNALGTGRHPAQTDGITLAYTGGAGLEGSQRGSTFGAWLGTEAHGPVAEFRAPLFAPGPEDLGTWWEMLAHDPSLEPSICRVVNGLAPGMDGDRLRLTGNGVVPLAASYAFVSLYAALLDE